MKFSTSLEYAFPATGIPPRKKVQLVPLTQDEEDQLVPLAKAFGTSIRNLVLWTGIASGEFNILNRNYLDHWSVANLNIVPLKRSLICASKMKQFKDRITVIDCTECEKAKDKPCKMMYFFPGELPSPEQQISMLCPVCSRRFCGYAFSPKPLRTRLQILHDLDKMEEKEKKQKNETK
jgi:hypothetical protein